MAKKKGQGSSRNGRDSHSKRLGTKVSSGQFVTAGSILIRQRGSKCVAGANTGMGKDFTIFAKIDGNVAFSRSKKLSIVVV